MHDPASGEGEAYRAMASRSRAWRAPSPRDERARLAGQQHGRLLMADGPRGVLRRRPAIAATGSVLPYCRNCGYH